MNQNKNNNDHATDDEDQENNRYTKKGPNENDVDPQEVELKMQNQNNEFSEKEHNQVPLQELYHQQHNIYEDHGFSQSQLAYSTPAPTIFPRIPKKLIFVCCILFFTGFGFLIGGISDYFTASEKIRGICFIAFGGLLFIPGAYYSIQLYLAFRATTPQERAEILQEIPMDMEM